MGEYAKLRTTGTEIKIGTCENMYYLRLEDVNKIEAMSGNVDPTKDTGLYFRLPFPDEDKIKPGQYEKFDRSIFLEGLTIDDFTDDDAGLFYLHHDHGVTLSIPCYHGEKKPEIPTDSVIKICRYETSPMYEFTALKKHKNGKIYPVFKCYHCQKVWSCDWSDIWEYIPEDMQKRLEKYKF